MIVCNSHSVIRGFPLLRLCKAIYAVHITWKVFEMCLIYCLWLAWMTLMCLVLKHVFSLYEVLIYFVQPLICNMCEFKFLMVALWRRLIIKTYLLANILIIRIWMVWHKIVYLISGHGHLPDVHYVCARLTDFGASRCHHIFKAVIQWGHPQN